MLGQVLRAPRPTQKRVRKETVKTAGNGLCVPGQPSHLRFTGRAGCHAPLPVAVLVLTPLPARGSVKDPALAIHRFLCISVRCF